MPVSRTYVGDQEVYVPDLGRWVSPGDDVEFESADQVKDDPRFVTKSAAKSAEKQEG